ncbi:CAAX prenyl protease-related protein [Azohydromonas aeria]|uniref:CAAX prenyl protease-related protein n=1 Tax=Azohydromonas aeria TaxID=2590212 RepID=UPI0012FA53DB|nr:CAAX prenyl protease-related protein [Azohydromonas aeria]
MTATAAWMPRRAALVRCAPFVVFMALLALRGAAAPDTATGASLDARWLYALNLPLVGGLLWWWWREYAELRERPPLREALLSVAVGLVVFGLWIHLDAPWMQLGEPAAAFAPLDAAGRLDWGLIAVRLLGAALLVPVMEELFWRGFLMRWLQQPEFETVDPRRTGLRAIAISTALFMLAHTLWLAAVVAGLAYALLYARTGRLWNAVIAHAVTNGALGAWVVATGNWQFW